MEWTINFKGHTMQFPIIRWPINVQIMILCTELTTYLPVIITRSIAHPFPLRYEAGRGGTALTVEKSSINILNPL